MATENLLARLAFFGCLGALTSCGGGFSQSSNGPATAAAPAPSSAPAPSPAPAPAPAPAPPVAVSGVVATGFPIPGATIVVSDRTGAKVATVQSQTDGTFAFQPAATAVAPFVLVASAGTTTLVSVVADTQTPVVNITPLTNLVAALLSTTGSPVQLVSDITSAPSVASAALVTAAKNEVATLLAPLTTAIGLTSVDVIDTAFVANGTGLDQVLDSTLVSIRPTASGADVSLSIKQFLPDGVSPTTLTFTTTSPPTSVSYSVDPATLFSSAIITQAATLASSLNTCYALPPATRTNGTVVTAPACTGLFYNNDPTTYLNSGGVVSPSGSFSGLFNPGSNGLFWSSPTILYARSVMAPGGGTITAPVVRYMRVSTTGTVSYSVLTLAPTANGLQILGDQYQYGGSVFPVSTNFIFVNAAAENYSLAGIALDVPNTTSNVGGTVSSIFSKVLVTTPSGATYTLTPKSGVGFLVAPGENGQPGTSNTICLEGEFSNATTAQSHGFPSQYKTSDDWLNPPLTDAQIAQIPDQETYQYQYFLTGNSTSTPDATQYYRTEVRPQTLAEFSTYAARLAVITSPSVATIQAQTLGTAPNTYVAPPASGPLTISWSIPPGGPGLSTVEAFGYQTGTGEFEDSASIPAGTSSVAISCVSATSGDMHCTNGNYTSSDGIDVFNFIYTDPNAAQYIRSYGVYEIF